MAPNVNLFDLFNKKKMEKALNKDRRVKRLQREVLDKYGVKIALYSSSLILEENLSVEAAAKAISEHLAEIKQHKRSHSHSDRSHSRSPIRSGNGTKTVNPEQHKRSHSDRSHSRSPIRSGNGTKTVNPEQHKRSHSHSDHSHSQSQIKSGNGTQTVNPTMIGAAIEKVLPTLVPSLIEAVMQEMTKKRVVLLGDSILRRMERTVFFKNNFAGHIVTNLAIPGITVRKSSYAFLDFCQKNRFLQSSNLVILLGTNDFLKNGQFDFTAYYDITTNATALSFKNIIVVKLPPIPKKPFLAEAIRQTNEWIVSLGKRNGLKVIEAPQHMSSDGVHLNGWGMKVLATSILQQVSD